MIQKQDLDTMIVMTNGQVTSLSMISRCVIQFDGN